MLTYNNPPQAEQTNAPIVTFTYVGPLCPQSKQYLFEGNAANSLKVFISSSSLVFSRTAISLLLPESTKITTSGI